MTKVTSPYLLMLDSISDRFVTIKRIKKGSMIMVSGKCAGVVIYLLGYLFNLIIYLSILRLKEKYSKCQERKQLVNLTFFDCLGPNSFVCVCV